MAIFFPNEQNLVGLKEIVEEIIVDPTRKKPLDLLFVASRVPNLDDEEDILKNQFKKFEEAFNYKKDQFLQIHQYDSLRLLDQEVFVATRVGTKLAIEYISLAKNIIDHNIEDSEGAIGYLNRLLKNEDTSAHPRFQRGGKKAGSIFTRDRVKLKKIKELHYKKTNVMFMLANYYSKSLSPVDEAAHAIDLALKHYNKKNTEIDKGSLLSLLHHKRLSIYRQMGVKTLPFESAKLCLQSSTLPSGAFLNVLEIILSSAEDMIDKLPSPSRYPILGNLDSEEFITPFISRHDDKRIKTRFISKLIKSYLTKGGELNDPIDNFAILIFISGGMFKEADKILKKIIKNKDSDYSSTPILFNNAIVQWCLNEKPVSEFFEKVIANEEEKIKETKKDVPDANYNQCMALAYGVVGNRKKALKCIRTAIKATRKKPSDKIGPRERVQKDFSCWSFLSLGPKEFTSDCEQIEKFIQAGRGKPLVLSEALKV